MPGILARAALMLVLLGGSLAPASALAQVLEDERPPGPGERPRTSQEVNDEPGVFVPSRVLVTLGAGLGLRIVRDITFSQDFIAPPFLDLSGGYIFEGRGLLGGQLWRHGVGLTVSTGLFYDGPSFVRSDDLAWNPRPGGVLYALDTSPFEQWTFTPSYLGYFRFDDDWNLVGNVGLPIAVWPYTNIAVELGARLTYLFTAGFGAFLNTTFDVWFGAAGSVFPILNVGAGVAIDYEVLP